MMVKDTGHFKLLIIEDNPGDLALIEAFLDERFASTSIVSAASFHAAQSIFLRKEFIPDVVLLDLSLPDKSGETLIQEIVALSRNIPVVVLTGLTDVIFSIHSISMGVSDFLNKDDLTASMLYKSILYSIERKKNSLAIAESEKRYSAVFHFSPQAKWVIDPETDLILELNRAACDLYNYTCEEFTGKPFQSLFFPRMREAISGRLARRLGQYQGRFNSYKKDGTLVDVELYCGEFFTDGKPLFIVTATDITDKKQFEILITRAIIQAQETERFEIGAELHDNICQVLTHAQISIGMLKKVIDQEHMHWLKDGLQSIDMANKEIRSISHQMAPSFVRDMPMKDAIQMLLMESFEIANISKQSFHFDDEINKLDLDKDLPLNLYRILQEQLRNIQKHAYASEYLVDLSLTSDMLVMSISDNGVGFDTSLLKMGIGFANIKRRAELFGGYAEIHSEPGKGCELMVMIPIVSATQKLT